MRLFRAAFLPLIAAVALVATACVPPPDGGGGSTTNLSPFAVATADPTTGQAPLLVQFSPAGSTDPDGFIESYSWNFGDGSPLSTVPNPVHTYAAGGTFTATLTVTDDGGKTANAAVVVVVTPPDNLPPVANITTTGLAGKVPFTVSVDAASSTDPDGSIVSYEWNFGDGDQASTPAASHTYQVVGTYVLTLTVTDNNGAVDTDSTIVSVVDNLAPTAAAVATPPTGKAPLAVSFDGSGSSDEDGNVVDWDWDFGDGSTGSGEVAIHVFDDVGTYEVTLTVTDDAGATDTTTITVVAAEPQPPVAVANATPDGTKAPLGVLFSSAGSTDPDGTIIGYSWDFKDGSPLSTAANPSHLYTAAGTYVVELTVTDDDFQTTTATVTVVVGPANVPPVASGTATPAVGKPVLDVQFSSAASTDPDGTIESYLWDFGDGSPTSTEANPNHQYDELGNYSVLLTVTDDDGATNTVAIPVSVVPNTPPTAQPQATPRVGKEPLTVQLSAATSTDSDGEIVGYEWDYTDDGIVDSTDVETSFDYVEPGTYTARLTVTDEDGAVDTATVDITVNLNQAPTAVAGADVQSGNAPLSVVFEGRDSLDAELEGTITYQWDFGDGSPTSDSPNPTHVFEEIGEYTVTLTVTDDNGAVDTDTLTITALDPVVRVSPAGDDGTGDGTITAPFATIQTAITGAVAQNKTKVHVAGGTYGGFTAASGVSVFGGFDQDLVEGGSNGATEVTIQAGPGAVGVTVANAAAPVTLGDLTVIGGGGANATGILVIGSNVTLDSVTVDSGQATGAGSSSYGVRAIDGAALTIVDSEIRSRNGVAGVDGADGVAGTTGPNGANGGTGESGGATSTIASPAVRTGGAGANGAVCALQIIICLGASPGSPGSAGGNFDPRGGSGGSGGATNSGGGGGGGEGDPAPAAAPGAAAEAVPGDTFDPGVGGTGGTSLAGAGGGGGGSGASNGSGSGAGGAGGAGGSAGTGGAGGSGGGGSFAVYSSDSSVTIAGGQLITGNGGAGGAGGDGGQGGNGGRGGNGGNGGSNRGSGGGGGGGAAGNGGAGGAGGNGGPSVGAYHSGTGTQVIAAADPADLTSIGTAGAPGVGGAGGARGTGGAGGNGGTGGGAGSPGTAAGQANLGSAGDPGANGLRRLSFDNGQVNNAPPVAAAAANRTSGIAPEAVTFSSTGSFDSDGTITYLWDFGDGATSTEANPTHTYTADGEFTPTLTVTDDDGATATASTATITIAANQLPVAVANGTPDKANLKAPLVVDFSSAGTIDPDGTIVSYSWDFGDGTPASTQANPTHTYSAQGVFDVVLTVTDDKGGVDTASATVTVNPNNVAPAVAITATPAFGKSPNTVTFTSTISDSDGSVASIVWDFGDGSPTSTNPNPVHTYGVGVFVATLTVTDDDGATTTRSVEIRSLPNIAPQPAASATPTSGRAPLTVQLSSAGSIDFDGSIASYSWNFGDGSPVSSNPNPSHVYAAGTWTATLTVTDNEGASQTATVQVQSLVNQAPTAVANATPVGINNKAPYIVDFSSAGSADNDCAVVNACPGLSYSWDFGDGSAVSTDPSPTHTYAAAGTYAATLTVTDSEGATDVKAVTINVADPNVLPVPQLGASTTGGRAPLAVDFTSTGSVDPDGTIVTTLWDFGDGSPVVSTPDASHTYGPGTFTATLTVVDDDGASVTTSTTIDSTVNIVPVAQAAATPTLAVAPATVEFSSAGSADPDGTIVSYAWDFGDGATSSDPNPTHIYAAGTYTATLYVVDDEGGIGTATVQVVSNVAPSAVASADVTDGDGPLEVSFTGSDSIDVDGTISAYEWDFGDGSPTSSAADPTHTYAPGIWTATLTVTDDRGATATATVVIDANDPPSASVTSDVTSGSAPLTVAFDGLAGDADGTFTISWDFGDGSPAVTDTLSPSHTYTGPGTYEATLTVTDDRGSVTVSAPRVITVD
jgi:PKD repeat protein